MPILSAKVDIDGPLQAFEKLRAKQLPWTIARALTQTAKEGQGGARKLEGEVFKLRNDWTVQSTKIVAATNNNLVAQVLTDTANRKSGAPDYLGDQESGGDRVPVGGRMHRAVPTQYLLRMCGSSGVIPDELRPRNLLGAVNDRYSGWNRKGQIALRNQKIVRGMVFFLANLPGGSLAIYGRYWTERDAYPMYVLTPEAHLRAIFPMEKTVVEIVEANFPENFSKAATETIANDLLHGSGLRVKL